MKDFKEKSELTKTMVANMEGNVEQAQEDLRKEEKKLGVSVNLKDF